MQSCRSYAAVDVDDAQDRKQAALTELAEADRAYRAEFSKLTSRGGLDRLSFDGLLESVKGLHDAVQRLRDAEDHT